jgi:hypothetical protein
MPKRTKREKILADARRIVQQAHQNSKITLSDESSRGSIPELGKGYTFKAYQNVSPVATETISDVKEFTAIRKDLIKTVILAGAAIGIELLLYLKIGK